MAFIYFTTDCNLNSGSKTCAGELGFSAYDEDLEDILDELALLQGQDMFLSLIF